MVRKLISIPSRRSACCKAPVPVQAPRFRDCSSNHCRYRVLVVLLVKASDPVFSDFLFRGVFPLPLIAFFLEALWVSVLTLKPATRLGATTCVAP